jgi:hypothetical protein
MDALGRAMFPQGGSYFGHRVRLHAPPYSRGFMYRTYPIRPVRLRGVWASLVAPHPSGCPGAGGRKSHRLWRGRCRRLGRWHPDLRGTAPHRQKPTSCVSGRSRVGVWETNSRTRLRHRLPLSLIHTAYSSSHCCSPSVLSFHIQMALVESSQSHPSPRRTPGKRGTPRSGCEVRQPSRHPRRIVPPLGCGGRNTHSIKTRPRLPALAGDATTPQRQVGTRLVMRPRVCAAHHRCWHPHHGGTQSLYLESCRVSSRGVRGRCRVRTSVGFCVQRSCLGRVRVSR